MQQIVNFILRNKTFLLFVLLLFVSVMLTIQSHSYHRSRFINSANFLSGGIYNASNSMSEYFDLKNQNKLLQEDNKRLKSILYNTKQTPDTNYIDSTNYNKKYKFTAAQVIRNSYATTNNILLLNKGDNDRDRKSVV